jgi:hypothetical protein
MEIQASQLEKLLEIRLIPAGQTGFEPISRPVYGPDLPIELLT